MTAQIRARDSGGTLRTPTIIRGRDRLGVLHQMKSAKGRDATGTLHILWTAPVGTVDADVALSTYSAFKQASGAASNGLITSDAVVATARFGTPGYTYQWNRTGGSSGITITSPTAASTTFSGTTDNSKNLVATYRCIVRDSLGVYKYSADLTVELDWIDTR